VADVDHRAGQNVLGPGQQACGVVNVVVRVAVFVADRGHNRQRRSRPPRGRCRTRPAGPSLAAGGWCRVIEDDITTDTGLLRVADIFYDEWSGEPVRQRLERRTGVPIYPVPQTYKGMTHGMTELMTLTRSRAWSHHGNPVAEFCFDSVEVRHPPGEPDLIRPDKPERGKTGNRIDAVPTAAMAVSGWRLRGEKPRKSSKIMVVG
jgi:hypothetical protein